MLDQRGIKNNIAHKIDLKGGSGKNNIKYSIKSIRSSQQCHSEPGKIFIDLDIFLKVFI
jgi:hypothetical protein